MALGKRLIQTGGAAACNTETTDIFGGSTGKALYSLDYDSFDTSGTFNGEPYNGVNFGVSGKINTGARFNGTNQFIKLGTDVFKYTDVTISAFINPNLSDTNVKTIFANTSYISGQAFHGIIISVRNDGSSDKIYVQHYPSSTAVYSTASISLNTFTHIAVSYTGSQTKIYINGTLDSTHSATLSYSASQTLTASLGAYILHDYTSNTTYDEFSGTIDQVRVFSSILDGTQISTLAAEQACVHTSTTDIVDFPVTNAAYYKLDNSAEDEKGTSSSETDIEYRFGRYGQAAIFDGANSVITNSSVGTALNVSAFTFSLWFKTNVNDSTDRILISSFDGSGNARFYVSVVNSGLSVVIYGSSSTYIQNFTSTVGIGNWYHLAVTHTGTTTTVYLNGTAITPSGTSGSAVAIKIASSPQPLTFGQLQGNIGTYPLNGSIDQVRIFTSSLSAANVLKLAEEKPETDTSNFKAVLYTGNGATQFISNVGMDLETSGGLVWVKNRSATGNHSLIDNVRGVSKPLNSNATNAEQNYANFTLTSFEKNGFFVTDDSNGLYGWNGAAGGTYGGTTGGYVGWVWKGGGTAVSNGNGSITSSVSANTAAGFSIVSYTGTGANATIGHGLTSAAPELIIFKNRDSVSHWDTYSLAIGATKRLQLSDSGAASASNSIFFNNTDPTTSVFSVGSGLHTNGSGDGMVAYCFHSVSGYQKISTYSAGSVGLRIYTTDDGTSSGSNGFRPSFVMIKNTTIGSTNWVIVDSKRPDKWIYANESDADATVAGGVVLQDDGFSLGNQGSYINASGSTYLYMAIK